MRRCQFTGLECRNHCDEGKCRLIHTGAADCPACKLLEQDLSPQQSDELVQALMKDWDAFVERAAVLARDRLKSTKLFASFGKKTK